MAATEPRDPPVAGDPVAATEGVAGERESHRDVRTVRLPSGQVATLEGASRDRLLEAAAALSLPAPLSAAEAVSAIPLAPLESSLLQHFRVPANGAAARPNRRATVSLAPDQLLRLAGNPVPEGTVCGTLRTADHVRLRFARFPATARPTRGTVLILQGRAEFIEKYFETAQDLSGRGFCVATFDFRGQGRSQRQLRNERKGHVDDFGEYVLDVEAVMRGLVMPDCPPPYFLLAHSMGSLAALLAAAERPNWFERIVLVAPFLGVPPGRFTGLGKATLAAFDAAGLGAAFVPGGRAGPVHLRAFIGNPFTSDPPRYRRIARVLRTVPELATGSPTVGWARAALRAISQATAHRFTAQLPVPVLAIAAGGDRVVDNAAIERFGRMLRAGGTVVLPNAQHEILAERDAFRDLFWAAFEEFVPGTSLLA